MARRPLKVKINEHKVDEKAWHGWDHKCVKTKDTVLSH